MVKHIQDLIIKFDLNVTGNSNLLSPNGNGVAGAGAGRHSLLLIKSNSVSQDSREYDPADEGRNVKEDKCYRA